MLEQVVEVVTSPGPASTTTQVEESLASPSIPDSVPMEVAGSEEIGGSEDTSSAAEVAAAMVASPCSPSTLSPEEEVRQETGVKEDSVEMAVEEDRVEMEDGVEATATADTPGDQEASQQRVGATLGLDEEMALKLILHALEEKETPKFEMGLEALLQLQAAKQLQNYPLFCENVLLIPYIRFKVPEDLLEALEAAAASPFHSQHSSDAPPDQSKLFLSLRTELPAPQLQHQPTERY